VEKTIIVGILAKISLRMNESLGMEVGFDFSLTTYVTRHSFVVILVRSGAAVPLAKQSLGHARIASTEKYFAGFNLAAEPEYERALVNI
jgi:site-specific recombinase XerD